MTRPWSQTVNVNQTQVRPTSAPQIPLLGLDSWLGGWEHLLLFQRTWSQCPARSGRLTAVHNTSLRGSDAFFSPQWMSRKHIEHIHTCKQNTHAKKIKTNVKQHFHTTNENQIGIHMCTCIDLGHSSKSRTVIYGTKQAHSLLPCCYSLEEDLFARSHLH